MLMRSWQQEGDPLHAHRVLGEFKSCASAIEET
jgi:hypothetical protein